MSQCLVCKKEIPYIFHWGKQPGFCCEEHRTQWARSRSAQWKRDHPEKRWKPDIPKQKCPICGKNFSPSNHGQVFCSKSCHAKYYGEQAKKPLPSCEVCGKPCKKLRRRFCSPECKVKWYQGKNVYNFVGERYRSDPSYNVFVWTDLAKEIRKRDKVCRHCGKTPEQNGKALDVHHIIPFRFSKDDSPSNLIALCAVCHKKAEHKYLSENNLYKHKYNKHSK